jgi:pSer/pThr/pTyr-binding forkhead associated (FHA) protein
MATKIVLELIKTGQALSVDDLTELSVGRARKDEVPTIDLTPYGGHQAGVSRRHSRLLYRDDQWFIEDLDSTNGTFVNGIKIPPRRITPVHEGDVLRFGLIELGFGLEDL